MRFKRLYVYLILLSVLMSACATLDISNTDPTRTALYATKQSWVEIRTYVISKNVEGKITDEQLIEFKKTDDSFTLYYNLAIDLYLKQQSGSQDYNYALDVLKKLILEAREKYYK